MEAALALILLAAGFVVGVLYERSKIGYGPIYVTARSPSVFHVDRQCLQRRAFTHSINPAMNVLRNSWMS